MVLKSMDTVNVGIVGTKKGDGLLDAGLLQ